MRITIVMMPPTDGLIGELPSNWRLAGQAVIAAICITAGYFIFVGMPMAAAQSTADRANARVAAVETNISQMQGDISEIRGKMERADQKTDDMKDDLKAMNAKLDRLLTRGQSARN